MAERRLIDANALERWLKTNMANANPLHCDIKATYSECITMVHCMETIDAAPVVRCRECIHRVRTNSTLGFSWCGKFGNVMRDADFCSWGEQKMDGGAENGY